MLTAFDILALAGEALIGVAIIGGTANLSRRWDALLLACLLIGLSALLVGVWVHESSRAQCMHKVNTSPQVDV